LWFFVGGHLTSLAVVVQEVMNFSPEVLQFLSVIFMSFLSSSVSAQTVEVKEGWNLLGTACEIPVESLDNSSIKTVWIWDKDENFWKLWSPIQTIIDIAQNYGIETFDEIPAYSGFWISASNGFNLPLCDSYSVENLVPFRGKVKYIDLEGGFYGIVDDTGSGYLPINLSDEFKVDGLSVEGIGKLEEGVYTVYMWGIPIEVLKIEKIENSEDEIGNTPTAEEPAGESTAENATTIDFQTMADSPPAKM